MVAQMVNNLSAMQETGFDPWVGILAYTILFICSPGHGYLSCLRLPTKMHRGIIQIVVLKFLV